MTSSSFMECGPFTIRTDFDSANALRAELVLPDHEKQSSGAPSTPGGGDSVDFEINFWTKPDCHGTPFENGNRTWFYFGINGGPPNALLKINVLNLNKQIKLFTQGMQPVFRHLPSNTPPHVKEPSWERVHDCLLINEAGETGVCNISFRQRSSSSPSTTTLYIAFTYPYSYSELLSDLDSLVNQYPTPHIHRKDGKIPSNLSNEVYFVRENVCNSLEGRRIELITITSLFGASKIRERRLKNLFLDQSKPRPWKFPGKKVVFLSSRVHPGETCSSFVLNGFLKFILRDSPEALLLRRHFVFKIIPILNPDGVVRGHYRTDTRGVNLNRVYLTPTPTHHPSIYAARKLLLYYHCGQDPPEVTPKDLRSSGAKESTGISSKIPKKPPNLTSSAAETEEEPPKGGEEASTTLKTTLPSTLNLTTSPMKDVRLCAGCCDELIDSESNNSSQFPTISYTNVQNTTGSSHTCAFEACDEDSLFYANEQSRIEETPCKELKTPPSSMNRPSISGGGVAVGAPPRRMHGRRSLGQYVEDGTPRSKSIKRSSSPDNPGAPGRVLGSGKRSPKNLSKILPSLFGSGGIPSERKSRNGSFGQSKEDRSGLFLYIDLHAHATKRGIFMYGNHFSDINAQAECMLLPKLMSLNSAHFDFSACNFTERLMNLKDRRDGASRDGSGRVSCTKLTGLIQSYTLECNYNTGRIVNTLPPRHSEPPTLQSTTPSKFTPSIFEQIGSALAESLLDLIGVHPDSRLRSSDLKSIEGVRKWLLKRLKMNPEYKSSPETLEAPPPSKNPSILKRSKVKPALGGPQGLLGGPLGSSRRENQVPGSPGSRSPLAQENPCSSSTLMEEKPLSSLKGSGRVTPTVEVKRSSLSNSLKSKKKRRIVKKKKLTMKLDQKSSILDLKLTRDDLTDENSAISLRSMDPGVDEVILGSDMEVSNALPSLPRSAGPSQGGGGGSSKRILGKIGKKGKGGRKKVKKVKGGGGGGPGGGGGGSGSGKKRLGSGRSSYPEFDEAFLDTNAQTEPILSSGGQGGGGGHGGHGGQGGSGRSRRSGSDSILLGSDLSLAIRGVLKGSGSRGSGGGGGNFEI